MEAIEESHRRQATAPREALLTKSKSSECDPTVLPRSDPVNEGIPSSILACEIVCRRPIRTAGPVTGGRDDRGYEPAPCSRLGAENSEWSIARWYAANPCGRHLLVQAIIASNGPSFVGEQEKLLEKQTATRHRGPRPPTPIAARLHLSPLELMVERSPLGYSPLGKSQCRFEPS